VTGVVVDASVALAWVPALWALEIANGLMVGERRKRLQQADISRFLALLQGLTIVQDERSVTEMMTAVVPLAREHKLSAYDAAYLDVAIREDAPPATLDSGLRKAAKAAGVRTYQPGK
jgi:predicted nucleic acid-binding protein